MTQILETPNQKSSYARVGIAMAKAAEALLNDEMSIEEKEIIYKGVDSVSKSAGAQCKLIMTELNLAKMQMEIEQHAAVIRNSKAKVRNLESKVFDELPE